MLSQRVSVASRASRDKGLHSFQRVLAASTYSQDPEITAPKRARRTMHSKNNAQLIVKYIIIFVTKI
jgi:hypothetical protein